MSGQPKPIRWTLDADVRKFGASVKKAAGSFKDLEQAAQRAEKTASIDVDVDSSALEVLRRRLREARAQTLKDLEVDVDVDVVKATTRISQIEKRLRDLDRMDVKTDVSIDKDGLGGRIRALHSTMQGYLRPLSVGIAFVGAGQVAQQIKQFTSTAFSAFGKFEQSQGVLADALNLDEGQAKTADALIKQIGATSRYSATQVSEAAVALGKAGLGFGDIAAGALKASTDLAATEGIAVEKSAEVIANAMAAFRLPAAELPRLADQFAMASTMSTASVESLAYGMSQASAAAADAGLSVGETLSSLALLENVGIKGSDAGTSLKTFFATLVPKSKNAHEAMTELGMEFFNAQGQMKPMVEIIKELEDGFTGLSDFEKKQALNDIFGSDASRAAATFAKTGVEGYKKMLIDVEKMSPGAAAKMALTLTKGFEGAKERLGRSLENLYIAFGEAFGPAAAAGMNILAERVVPRLVKMFEKIDGEKLGESIDAMGDGVDAVLDKVENWFKGKNLTSLLDVEGAGGAVERAFGGVDWDAVGNAFEGIGDAMSIIGGAAGAFVGAFRSMPPGLQEAAATVATLVGAWKILGKSPVLKIGVDLVKGALAQFAAKIPKFPSKITASLADSGVQSVRIAGQPIRVTTLGGAGGKGGRVAPVPAGGSKVTKALGVAGLTFAMLEPFLPQILQALGASPKLANGITGVVSKTVTGAFIGNLIVPGVGGTVGGLLGAVSGLMDLVPQTDQLRVDVDSAVTQAGAAGVLAGAAAVEAAKAHGAAIRALNDAKADLATAQGELNQAIATGDRRAIADAKAKVEAAEKRLREADLREKAIRERQKLWLDAEDARLRQQQNRMKTIYDERTAIARDKAAAAQARAEGAYEKARELEFRVRANEIALKRFKRDPFGEITLKPGDAYPYARAGVEQMASGRVSVAGGRATVFAPTIVNNYPKQERASDSLAVSLRAARWAAGG